MHNMFPVYEFHSSRSQKILCGLKMFVLLSFGIITGLMAEDLKVTYQLKAGSVCLNVETTPPYKSTRWTFYKDLIVLDKEINPNYSGKVVYNPGNLSLCINNLMDADAGIYEVSFSRNFKSVSEKHQVIVEEMVPRPVIAMSDSGSNMSAGLCSISVNCSIQDEWLWALCDEEHCRPSQKVFSKVNITIFRDNGTVICSGSNHVSTNSASEPIMTCSSELNTEEKEEALKPLPIGVFIAPMSLFVLPLIIFLAIIIKKKFSTNCKSYQQQTSTVRSIQSQPMGTLPPSQPRVSTGSSSSDADPAYENADIIEISQTSSPREERHKVDTIYSLPDGKAASANNTQNSAEAAATVEEAPRPTQIDTVYSVLQKPKQI